MLRRLVLDRFKNNTGFNRHRIGFGVDLQDAVHAFQTHHD